MKQVKNYVKKLGKDFRQRTAYLRLMLQGNSVERKTDFSTCEHPVLLLYGFGATRRVFGILERRLRKDDFCVFSVNLGGAFNTFNTRCIEELAELVAHKVEVLSKRYHFKKISIIGHSKGGLIGRYYVQVLGGSKRVNTLITLGTPHYGNSWAALAFLSPAVFFSKSIRQMLPGSGFLKKLHQHPWPQSVGLVSIFSKRDRVSHYKRATLRITKEEESMMKNIELQDHTHADYIIRKQAYEIVKRELLEAGTPTVGKQTRKHSGTQKKITKKIVKKKTTRKRS